MKTLYIIHGWTYTVEPWAGTLKQLRDDGYTIKMLHVPGLTEPSKKIWTIDEYVKWADCNIPDGAVALGHSNGGRILLNLCSQKPDKLKHLILLDAAGVYEKSKKRTVARKLSKILAPLKKVKPIRKVVHKLLGASDYDRAPENMKQTLANMLESDKSLKIESVTTPTTIIWGEADSVTPIHQGIIMHEKIAGSEFISRKKWTHSPYIFDPTGLARTINVVMKGIK